MLFFSPEMSALKINLVDIYSILVHFNLSNNVDVIYFFFRFIIMASVDGSKSLLASSDEVIQHTCGPCKDEGDTTEAKHFCENCKEYLCFDCRNDHKTFKATKKHSVVSAHVTQYTESADISGKFAIMCGCDQKQTVRIYCENHTEVICTSCETIKHRTCKTCPIKDKVTKDTEKEFKELMTKSKSLKVEFEKFKDDVKANRSVVEVQRGKLKKEVAEFRKNINDVLDRMESGTLENVDANSIQHLCVIDKRIVEVETSQKALNTSLYIIDGANKSRKTDIMFSATVKLSKRLSEYDNLLKEMKNEMQLPMVKFLQNETLTTLLGNVETLGRIEYSEVESNEKDHIHVELLDLKVKSKKEVNIKLSDDKLTPQVTGCAFLSDGRILLCDFNNDKVKMLDNNMAVTKSLKLPNTPRSVAAISGNEAIIAFNDEKDFQFIHTHPELKLGQMITSTKTCRGLCVANYEIYTTCHNKDYGYDEIRKLDKTGNIISKIVLTQSSSSQSATINLGLCLTGPNPRVYLASQSKVTCFHLDGKIVYQFKDTELKASNGIYVDSIGNSIVCSYASQNVVVITADGLKHVELLKFDGIARPRCIDYRPKDNTLIVGCAQTNSLFAYKLGK